MRFGRSFGLALIVFAAGAAGAAAPVAEEALERAEREGRARVIVHLAAPGTAAGRPERAARSLAIAESAGRVLGRLGGAGSRRSLRSYEALPFLALEASRDELRRLAEDPEVLAIEEDRRLQPALAQSIPWIDGDLTKAAGYDGRGWAVAILDSGIDASHPTLAGSVVEEACFSAGADCPNGQTTQYGAGAAVPCTYASTCFHGTHVAGIAVGAFGAAPAADIISIQVSSEETGAACGGSGSCITIYTSDVVAALDYVETLAASRSIAAVNMSFGTDTTWGSESACNAANAAFKTAIDAVSALGIAAVAAAGNENVTNGIDAPGCISSAAGVGGSLDSSDTVWIGSATSGSNSGAPLDYFAPASPITSAVPSPGTTGTYSGTSMATPHVAGTLVLLRQAAPGATLSSLRATLANTGASVTDTRNGITRPRVDADDAVRALAPAQCFDGLDNDGDGRVDVDGDGGTPDPDCTNGFDDLEQLMTPPGCGIGPELALLLPLLALLGSKRSAQRVKRT